MSKNNIQVRTSSSDSLFPYPVVMVVAAVVYKFMNEILYLYSCFCVCDSLVLFLLCQVFLPVDNIFFRLKFKQKSRKKYKMVNLPIITFYLWGGENQRQININGNKGHNETCHIYLHERLKRRHLLSFSLKRRGCCGLVWSTFFICINALVNIAGKHDTQKKWTTMQWAILLFLFALILECTHNYAHLYFRLLDRIVLERERKISSPHYYFHFPFPCSPSFPLGTK